MSYTVENTSSCSKKINFNFESLDLSDQIKQALVKKQKDTSLKGFRKGKAPLSAISRLYRPQVENDALHQFIQAQFIAAIEKEKIQVVGQPVFQEMEYNSGKSVNFTVTLENFPTITLKDMQGLLFNTEAIVVSDEEIKKSEEGYLSSKSEMLEVEAPEATLQKGHTAVLNFQGVKENGDRPADMKGEDYQLEIGSGQFIPGFEDGMIGMKKGEKKNIDLTFPAEYHQPELQNTPVTFEAELLEIKEKKYPSLTDELALELNFKSVEDFHIKNKENLTKQKKMQIAQKLNQDILAKLLAENPFDVPKAMVEQQKNHLREDLENKLKAQGLEDKMMGDYFEKWNKDMDEKAVFQVKTGLILDKLAKEFNIEANDEDFTAKMTESAEQSGMDLEQVKNYYNSTDEVRKNVMYAIREEKTFAKILEIVTVVEG